MQTELSTARQNSRTAQQSALVSQLRDLYGISQEAQFAPEKLRAGQLANQRAQTELDILPRESESRMRAQDAQSDYYNIRAATEQRPDPRDLAAIAPFLGTKGEVPEWMVSYLPPEVQQGLRAQNAAKAAEKAAQIERDRMQQGTPAPTGLPPGTPDNPAGRLGGSIRSAFTPGESSIPSPLNPDFLASPVGQAPVDFIRGLGVPEGTIRGIDQTIGNIGSAPAEGLIYYLQKLGVSPETLRSWGLTR